MISWNDVICLSDGSWGNGAWPYVYIRPIPPVGIIGLPGENKRTMSRLTSLNLTQDPQTLSFSELRTVCSIRFQAQRGGSWWFWSGIDFDRRYSRSCAHYKHISQDFISLSTSTEWSPWNAEADIRIRGITVVRAWSFCWVGRNAECGYVLGSLGNLLAGRTMVLR